MPFDAMTTYAQTASPYPIKPPPTVKAAPFPVLYDYVTGLNLAAAREYYVAQARSLEPIILEPIAEDERDLMRTAAAVIRKYGHCKNELGSPFSGFCLLGALSFAETGDVGHHGANLCAAVVVRLVSFINPRCKPYSVAYAAGVIATWNDADARTADDVLALLDNAASA